MSRRWAWMAFLSLLLGSCVQPIASPAPEPTTTFTPFQPLVESSQEPVEFTPAPMAAVEATSSPQPQEEEAQSESPDTLALWIDPALPASFRANLTLPTGYLPAASPKLAHVHLEPGAQALVSQWVYAVVAPFPTLEQGVSSTELRQAWSEGQAISPLLMDENTFAFFTALWGAPADGAVQVLPAEQLLDYAWEQPHAWALVPFEALQVGWKVLEVDGQSPLRNDFDLATYPLAAPISLVSAGEVALPPSDWLPHTNRRADHLTVLALTGVTALVRATAYTMEQRGVTYPGKDVRDWLRQADLTHISNEVPFASNCPYPDPDQRSMRFCSDPRYIKLLEDVGADIIELTGDHFQDWGREAMFLTLELYHERGWGYYGGGADLEEAQRPLLVEHNGNRLAFIGCNAKGSGFAQAAPDRPGAVLCGDWLFDEIPRLRQKGYLPIVTFQHFEYYTYQAQSLQKRDFRKAARAGAVIVSGSQAHQPQALELLDGSFIHYGLGNLFFDQYDVSKACRQAFIDRHVFYEGRYIGVELLPILFIDYARPRPMTPDEAEDLLRTVFEASGW